METKQVCCPEFEPAVYDDKIHYWQNKLFIKEEVLQIFHRPLNIGKTINKMWREIQDNHAEVDTHEFIMLCHEISPWKSEIYMNVKTKIPTSTNIKLTGTFISKVFEGKYSDASKWIKEMHEFIEKKERTIKRIYFYYPYCQKCVKIYKHNYCVAFAEVE